MPVVLDIGMSFYGLHLFSQSNVISIEDFIDMLHVSLLQLLCL